MNGSGDVTATVQGEKRCYSRRKKKGIRKLKFLPYTRESDVHGAEEIFPLRTFQVHIIPPPTAPEFIHFLSLTTYDT